MKQKVVKKSGIKGPLVVVLGCIHGNEKTGAEVIDYLKKIKIKRGTLVLQIGNPLAKLKNRRFIDQDLNRSFPGKIKGNYEEMLAYKLKLLISRADFVIDLHTSTADTKSFAIATKRNKSVIKLVSILNLSRIVFMNKNFSRKALTYYCKAGISLEYGKNTSKKLIIADILTMLGRLGLTDFKKRKIIKTKFYSVISTLKKNNRHVLSKNIRNFKSVKKGDIIANLDKKKLRATKNFYPILFGEKAYKDIFGFCAKKITIRKN